MGDTTYHAMAFAEGDIDNDGRFEPLAADMMPYGSRADIDAGPGDRCCRRTPNTGDGPDIRQMRSRCGTRQARSATAWPVSGVDATGWNWSVRAAATSRSLPNCHRQLVPRRLSLPPFRPPHALQRRASLTTALRRPNRADRRRSRPSTSPQNPQLNAEFSTIQTDRTD